MNSARIPDDGSLALQLCGEAEGLWRKEDRRESILNLAALQFLSLGYLGQGRDHAVLSYLREASRMAVEMGLFGVEDDRAQEYIATLSADEKEAHIFTAWGSFNYAT